MRPAKKTYLNKEVLVFLKEVKLLEVTWFTREIDQPVHEMRLSFFFAVGIKKNVKLA